MAETEEAPFHPHESIWKRWGAHQDWVEQLQKKATHKALDIPDDDMQIVNASKTTNGAGSGAIMAAALAGGIPAAVLAAALGLSAMKNTPPTTPTGPTDSAYDVLFYDKDGKLIDVPRFHE